MYLLDTNIFLEILLGQEQAESVKALFAKISPLSLHVSDFSLHSIGILLFRRNLHEVYVRLIEDAIINLGLLYSVSTPKMFLPWLHSRSDFGWILTTPTSMEWLKNTDWPS